MNSPTGLLHFAIVLLLSTSALLQAADNESPPAIPYSALDNYKVTFEKEPLETMQMERLWLRGDITIKMDPLEGHQVASSEGKASARFTIRNAPEFSVEILSFPERSFGHSVKDDTLNEYLEGLRLQHSPNQEFKIIKPSQFSETGPAEFRILGRKAHHIRYGYLDKGQRFEAAENWIEKDGIIHVVRVSAPSDRFELHFRDSKLAFTSMAEQER